MMTNEPSLVNETLPMKIPMFSAQGTHEPRPHKARWVWHLVSAFFYDRCPHECATRWWHALAYRDYATRRDVMVAWPFHYAVRGFRWLEWQWDKYRHTPGWLDRHTEAAIKAHNDRAHFYR